LQVFSSCQTHAQLSDSVRKCAVACQLGLLDASACALQPVGTKDQKAARERIALTARESGDMAPAYNVVPPDFQMPDAPIVTAVNARTAFVHMLQGHNHLYATFRPLHQRLLEAEVAPQVRSRTVCASCSLLLAC